MASFRSGLSALRHGQARLRSAVARLPGHAGFWLRAFSQATIDLTLRTHAGLRTRIVESPGQSLSQPELDELVSQLRLVAGKTLPAGSLTYGIFSGEREGLARAVVTLIYEETTGRPIAFNALSLMDVELDGEREQVSHLGLVMVDPEVKGQGLSWVLYGLTTLVLFARDGFRPKWISTSRRYRPCSAWSARPLPTCFRRRSPPHGKALRICSWRAASCVCTALCSA